MQNRIASDRYVRNRRGLVASPDGLGRLTPYGFSGVQTIPHCAPLECWDWMCRAAIDISLLWSERHQRTKIQGAASIVGAWFSRRMGWGSQHLRVQGCATIPHCAPLERWDWMCRAAIDISLLWSERQNRITLPRRIRIICD